MSQSVLHKALNAAVLRILRPLVAVLMRHGMAYGSFAELARKAYVDEGFARMEAAGKRPTVSAVSALTGLTRKETKRLKELAVIDEEASSRRYNRAIRVISGWIGDGRFRGPGGEPAVLPLEGEEGSFAALVKAYSGDIPPAAMLSVLRDSGSVLETDRGIVLQARAYIPADTPLEKLRILGTDVAELIDTIGHNLQCAPGELHFQRKVSNVLVHPDAVQAFRELSTRRSQLLLEDYHRWLSEHEIDPDAAPGVQPRYVAVGIYYSDYPGTGEEQK